MDLPEFIRQVKDFDTLSHPDKIKHFAWWLHRHGSQERFDLTSIRGCYRIVNRQPSDNPGRDLTRLEARRPRELLKDMGGYRLEASVRDALDAKYLAHETVVIISALLKDLPGKISDTAERRYLSEAIICYKHQAYRAATVMTWNLAFDHLLGWILADAQRLSNFNTSVTKRYPQDKKKVNITVSKREDFSELKESEVIEICSKASLISDDLKKILHEKLVRRNIAAHPSLVEIARPQADDTISDLVNNVILALG
ncbi:MAG: hypothetical protein JWN86_3827 [Planctomycetota bacterium]|nr:hypothetical protein [Planctomycetota bacterium]